MAHGKHQPPPQEEEGGEGAPLWIISFADMMSLLMAFFVMLSTFSGFGPSEAETLQQVVGAALAPNYYGGWHAAPPREALGFQAPAAGQFQKGSEKPTLEETQGEGLLRETPPGDFRTRKVFLVESRTIFWGAGTTLSPGGRDFLNTLASYAGAMSDRIIISENGPGNDPKLGLSRALTTLSYLATNGISRDRCSLAAQGMSPEAGFATERMLEIALLEESVYQ
jgi:outer membrane protein OmpA-like peptidoglycan-associated protein